MVAGKWRIDGQDLAILAGWTTDLGASAAASRRARLRRYGILESHRHGMVRHHESPLQAVAAGLLHARPALVAELSRPIHIDVLAAQQVFEARALRSSRSRLQWLSGASGMTFRAAFEELRNANLVLENPGPALNPDLQALRAFLEALHAQAALPHSLHDAVPIHSAGLEAAWTTKHPSSSYEDVATQEPFQSLHLPNRIQYRGPRRLDRWDQAFLFMLQDARHGPTPTAGARSKAVVMGLMSKRLAFRDAFAFRASFYGLRSFVADARQVYSDTRRCAEVDEERKRLGRGAGWLDAR